MLKTAAEAQTTDHRWHGNATPSELLAAAGTWIAFGGIICEKVRDVAQGWHTDMHAHAPLYINAVAGAPSIALETLHPNMPQTISRSFVPFCVPCANQYIYVRRRQTAYFKPAQDQAPLAASPHKVREAYLGWLALTRGGCRLTCW